MISSKEGYYRNEDGILELTTNAVVSGGKITFYAPAYSKNYYGLVSILDHEAVHVFQYRRFGPATNDDIRLRREFVAYKYQASRPAFQLAGQAFRQGQIGGWLDQINEFNNLHRLNQGDAIYVCQDISQC